MQSKRTSIVIVAATLALIAFAAVHAASALRAEPVAVAVVDVQKVFDMLKEQQAIQADIKTREEKLTKLQQDKEKKIAQLQGDLDLLAPGSNAFTQTQEEIEKALIEIKVWANYEQQKVNRERLIQIENLYRKMADAIGRVAEENGFDMVVYKETEPDFKGVTAQSVSAYIQLRKVIWSRPSLDITDHVIQKLNNEFENVR
jgi:Skp family chaperone for outer membrane proteins